MSDASVLVLRTSAVVPAWVAPDVIIQLELRDVGRGGVWSASVGLWQRYDQPWNGPRGARGTSLLVGTIGALYGMPARHDITIYRLTLTEHGVAAGWTHAALADDALQYGHLTLATCAQAPVATVAEPLRLNALARV